MTRPDDAAVGVESVRLDKWLWAARFYKTRSLAVEAITGGHVQVNGVRVKPARQVRVGEQVTIRKGAETQIIIVAGLSERRGPASVAQQLYRETDESRQQRAALVEQRRLIGAGPATRRPDKRERRQLVRFTGKGG